MDFNAFKEQYGKLVTEEERNEFISERINDLVISSDGKNKIGNNICGGYDKFIAPETKLQSNGSSIYPGLVLDDNIYKQFMDFICNDLSYISNEPSTIYRLQQFIWQYFGLSSGGNDNREAFYADRIPEGVVHLSELKGQNIAACSERSAVAHNLLTFLGLDSEIVFGKINGKESHAYVIFKSQKSDLRILYDPMNPIEGIIDGAKVYRPAIDVLKEEDYQRLRNGGKYNYNYHRAKKVFHLDEIDSTKNRIYSSDYSKYDKNNANSFTL